MRVAALLLVLAACGGGSKPSTTPVSNSSGASDSSKPPAPAAGDAKTIQRTQQGGVIELVGDHATAMPKASEEMSRHCGPDNYSIIQEGEEVIGADTPTGGGTVKSETAWRVHYQCGGPVPPP